MNPSQLVTDGLWLSPAIVQLMRAPAEKLLLANICQRAITTNGVCRDTNKELSEAVGIHQQTISSLIARLQQAALLDVLIDSSQANKRTLTPNIDLLRDYERIAQTPSLDYKQIAQSTPATTPKSSAQPIRICPVTGVDITHQGIYYPVVTAKTIKQLFKTNRSRFNELITLFGLPDQSEESMGTQCLRVEMQVRRGIPSESLLPQDGH